MANRTNTQTSFHLKTPSCSFLKITIKARGAKCNPYIVIVLEFLNSAGSNRQRKWFTLTVYFGALKTLVTQLSVFCKCIRTLNTCSFYWYTSYSGIWDSYPSVTIYICTVTLLRTYVPWDIESLDWKILIGKTTFQWYLKKIPSHAA